MPQSSPGTRLFGALLALALTCSAFDSVTPLSKIPPHVRAWVEMPGPDVRTALLWKFKSEADQAENVDALLNGAELDDLVADDGAAAALSGGQDARPEPTLTGTAKPTAGAGRFGGGLVLDGTGTAAATLPVADLLNQQGGLTLDLWFRPGDKTDAARCVFAFCELRNRPLVAAQLTADARLTLVVDGETRLQLPVHATADGWHHIALTLKKAKRSCSLALAVDGQTASVNAPDWLENLGKRLGPKLSIGGAPGLSGFVGAIDEVHLSRGVRHLYSWNLGVQTQRAAAPEIALAPPFFKQGEVLTRFRFDGALAPEVFAGRSWSGTADATHFQPGLRGQALDLSRIDQTEFGMKGFTILPEQDGTVEFWFRPLDWHNFYLGEYDGRDVPYTWLMTLTAKDALHRTPTKNVEVFRGRACRDAKVHWQKIHPGTWTHALISVKEKRPTVYVNGRKQKLRQVGLVLRGHPYSREPLEAWRKRTGGKDIDDTWTLAFAKSATLVDEFSVYSWPMAAEEAWNAYARWLPDEVAAMEPLPVFRVDFDYFAHSWNMQEKLQISLACLPVNGSKPVSADCELRNAAGEALLTTEKQALDEAGTTTFVLGQALPFGRYTAVVRSRAAAGTVLGEKTVEYVREKPDWLGNTLGEERTVPEPWTPITVDGRTVQVIGREIELGANGLPARLETLDRQLLAAPVAMRVTAAGTAAELTGAGPTFTETAADRVAWAAELSGAGLTAKLNAWLEFDGLICTTVDLRPTRDPVVLTALRVDVPLTAKFATQLLANGGGNNFRTSWIATFVPDGNGSTGLTTSGSVWNSLDKPYPAFTRAHGVTNFMPHIWLGSDDVGLYFGAENDQGWTVDGPQPAQEILRENDRVVFRMNIIREPTTIGADGRRFHFILLPTPAKPEPPDWRKQMLGGGVNFGSCDTFGGFDLKTDPADPSQGDAFRLEPRSWEHAAQAAPQCRAKWGRCILYADMSWAGFGPAFRDWNHDLHAGTGRLALFPEMEDYMVWAVNEFLKRGLIDGVYWDDVSVGYTYSLASTAYEYAGSENGRRVGFTALAQRRVNMRLWRLFQAAGREPCIWAHMTVCYEVPLFSFCRYLSNCEFVTGVDYPGKRDAMDMWSPDTLRILGGSAKWGTGYSCLTTLPRTLPDTAAAKQWLYPQARTEDGLYLTHDIMQLSGALARQLISAKVFDGPVEVLPWWKADRALNVTVPEGADVLSAVYRMKDQVVVVVANRDREERDVTVALKPGAFLDAGGVRWRDLDPGLEPPEQVAASAEEVNEVGAAMTGLPGEQRPLDAATLDDELNGTTSEGRALQRLELRIEGNRARVVVRPRDYRVLEVRPIR